MSDHQLRRIDLSAEAADAARKILEERDKLVEFVLACTDEQLESTPLEPEDPRRVGVVADHVADAYEYLGGWVREAIEGTNREVTGELVDALNADHAARVGRCTRFEVTEHLVRSGDEIAALVNELSDEQLDLFDGRVARLASIAARHAENHRSEIATALGTKSHL